MDTGLVKRSSFFAPMETVAGGAGVARRAEYLLVIYPYGELNDKLLEEQQQFLNHYGLSMKSRNRPHITVAAGA